MRKKKSVLIAGLAAVIAAACFTSAVAQTPQRDRYAPRLRYARPHIEITPRALLYRRCIDWLGLQYRPSGTVLYPQYSCWWVRG